MVIRLRRRGALLSALLAATLAATACGSGNAGGGSTDATPPDPATRLTFEGELFETARRLPPDGLAADDIEPAGQGLADGEPVAVGRATRELQSWELVSAGDDGWRVWQPAAIGEVLADAAEGARVLRVERVEWPDACLGARRPDEACAEVITPGYRVIVERDGEKVEYHTDLGGKYRIASPP
jgi:hypothetical protein